MTRSQHENDSSLVRLCRNEICSNTNCTDISGVEPLSIIVTMATLLGLYSCLFSGGGALVLGQEQDVRAGQFSSAESFLGTISRVNIWDRCLSGVEIRNMVHSCDEYTGNVRAWPDFIGAIHGDVAQKPSDFCRGRFTPNYFGILTPLYIYILLPCNCSFS